MPSDDDVDIAVAALRRGEVVGLPTETVYGLAADGLNPKAVAEIFSIKGRPTGHPLILHLGAASWLPRFAQQIPPHAHVLAAKFWPGPLTLVLRRSDVVIDEVTGGLDTVALRVPDHPVALRLLRRLGNPLAAPSANRFGGVSPTTKEHVVRDLGERCPLVLDGGAAEIGVESTIVDLSGDRPLLLRPGGVTGAELEEVLGVPVPLDDGEGPAAPGTLESHYAPSAQVLLVEPSDLSATIEKSLSSGQRVGVLSAEDLGKLKESVECIPLSDDVGKTAHDLYDALRRLDERGIDVILTTLPPPEGIGLAVTDRLRRAAAPRPAHSTKERV